MQSQQTPDVPDDYYELKAKKWNKRFMALAEHVAQWSNDPCTKVGSVIVDFVDKRVVGMGYNGFPRHVDDCEARYEDRDVKYGLVVHAEANAILNANLDRHGSYNLYTTLSPCRECAKLIIQAGISDVYYKELRYDAFTETMFFEAGVRMEQVE